MHITSVKIENYRAISNLQISFTESSGAPRPVSVIVGPNGCGKTSILFGIMQALRGIMGYRTMDVPEPTIDDIRLPSSTRLGWSEKPPESMVEVEVQFSAEEQEVIPEVLKLLNREPPPTLPEGRVVVQWRYPPGLNRDGSQREWWHADVIRPRDPFVRSWLRAKAWAIGALRELGSDRVSKLGGLVFFPQDRNLLRRVVGESDSKISSVEPDEDLPNKDTRDHELQDESISDILRDFVGPTASRADTLPDEWNLQKNIQEIFYRICAPKKYLGIRYRGIIGTPLLQEGAYQYPISHAASGEQVILEYITRLLRRGYIQQSIILIDEPEIHLHPKWIRQLYLALPYIGYQNQFIMTTHSDELRKRASADNAIIELGSLGAEK